MAALVVLISAVGIAWQAFPGKETRLEAAPASSSEPESTAARVTVIKPRPSGIPRVTDQPASFHAFESVELYAMVSGYLKTQAVDIGSRIKKGDVLAVIDAPREAKAEEEAAAMLEQAKARVGQAKARVDAMIAERKAADAAVGQAESDVDRVVARHRLAKKSFARIKDLSERDAIEARLLDEEQHGLDSAAAAEQTARLTVLTAKAQVAAAAAKVAQAKADVAEAEAAVNTAQAQLDTARVNVEYTKILAPFDGVVTNRAFSPGAFIRSASQGGIMPLLSVKRTDRLRVAVQVPDRDVVLASVGDPAEVSVDALEGRKFKGTVARIAEFEDPTTRTMRVEIDLPNPDDILRSGMYGRAKIIVEPASENLAVPAASLSYVVGKKTGNLYVVRDGKAHQLEVKLGTDNGSLVEILSGLQPEDQVIVNATVPLAEGLEVDAAAAPAPAARL
jgi:RND family efflux transporter MFP subunit